MIQQKEYDYSTASGSSLYSAHSYTYDDQGNVIQDVGDGQAVSIEYYPDLLNSLAIGQNYFSKSKNLPKKATISSGGSTQTITYTYKFDGSMDVTTYAY